MCAGQVSSNRWISVFSFPLRSMNRKRQELGQVGTRKYIRRTEIERKSAHEEDRQKQANANAPSLPPVAGIITSLSNNSPYSASCELWRNSLLPSEKEKEIDELVLARGDVMLRLRYLNHPITLFGEDDNMRLLRYKNLLKSGRPRGDPETEGKQNDLPLDLVDFKRSNKNACLRRDNKSKRKGIDGVDDGLGSCNGGGVGTSSEGVEGMIPDLELNADYEIMKTSFDVLPDEDKIVVFFKQLLKEWANELQKRPESEKRTDKGRSNDAILEQCAQNLAPLFRMCRKRKLPPDMSQVLPIIVANCLQRDYLAAMDHYIKLALCNAPCPIGVTMVDIHELATREKNSPNATTQTTNDETTRKYLQSVKSLMTLCQRRYPALVSKPVEFNGFSYGNGLPKGSGLYNGSCVQSLADDLRTGNRMRGSVSVNSISLNNGSVV